MDIKIGDVVNINKELRKVVSITRNTNGDPVIVWQVGKNTEGACMPSLWEEWAKGNSQNRRRGI